MKKNQSKIFGQELIMNLYDCNPETLKSGKKILEYSNRICKLIKVKKYGKATVKRFGKGYIKGFSLVQLIETSLVSGHFSEEWNRAYINIFSCKLFNHKVAKDFTKKFFEAKRLESKIITR
jgi:S-adenosylmethionine/arginine decarboxylase-like enzyme